MKKGGIINGSKNLHKVNKSEWYSAWKNFRSLNIKMNQIGFFIQAVYALLHWFNQTEAVISAEAEIIYADTLENTKLKIKRERKYVKFEDNLVS